MYPIGYQGLIQDAATSVRVDPLLVASVIRVESKFQTEDVSHAGAIGLMQLMPNTALWITNQAQSEGKPIKGYSAGQSPTSLGIPTVNIQLGSWYIHHLIDQFQGNEVAAIAAYNAGPQRVQQWLTTGQWDGQLVTSDKIPVGETRHFVGRVFYNYNLYKRIYGQDPLWQSGRN
jgi:soluble lytic murein transglycosylase